MAPEVEFKGKKEERDLARSIFNLMMQQGAMYALDTPIRQSLHNLAQYFFEQELRQDYDKIPPLIESALEKNAHIFAREERNKEVFFVTSKRGHPVQGEVQPPLPPRQLHPVPEGATSKPRRRVVRRPPMAPFWVRTAIRQMQPPQPVVPARPPVPTVEEVAVAAVAEEKPPRVTELPLADGSVVDLKEEPARIFAQHSQAFAEPLREALDRDFRTTSFGDLWYIEDQLEHFSKGRLNEIRRYVLEEEVPLSDETILADLFFKNPRDPDYDLWAFSLNARLLREKKEFEFVGVPGAHLWAVKGLPSIGTRELKASEIGQDYEYLLEEEEIKEPPPQLEHFLTFYEYRYGVLPYDALAQSFFPPAMHEDQRAAQLRFEVPQHYEAYAVELRYPSGNRGGWLWGLEEFFHSSLVPGAFIIISPTEAPNVFVLQYLVTDEQVRRLLVYEERKRRYIFDEILFYCEVEASMALSEERFPRLHNSKSLPPSKRKRPTDAVAHAFTLIGEQEDGRYRAALPDLFPVVNIEHPFSMAYLRQVLDEVDVFRPTDEEDVYLYVEEEEE